MHGGVGGGGRKADPYPDWDSRTPKRFLPGTSRTPRGNLPFPFEPKELFGGLKFLWRFSEGKRMGHFPAC